MTKQDERQRLQDDIGSCLSCQQSTPRRKSKSGKKQNHRILARFIDFLRLPHAHASTTLALVTLPHQTPNATPASTSPTGANGSPFKLGFLRTSGD
uniref:GG12535 n=1 Tax=Drosophila erecta TaxID=7220 RepID=B3P7M4_DROER